MYLYDAIMEMLLTIFDVRRACSGYSDLIFRNLSNVLCTES